MRQVALLISIIITLSFLFLVIEGKENTDELKIVFSSEFSAKNNFNQVNHIYSSYPSHTNIPRTNFTGTYNVSLFTNPDNAEEVIFRYLTAAESSIFVSMYTISRADFNATLIDLKNSNPAINISVLISDRRVGSSENEDTAAAAQSLVDAGIPVYSSTKDDDKVDGFYHAKYWIIDDKYVFIYSGNWSPRSVTTYEDGSFSSSKGNRDMGIAVHDAPDIATFFKNEVWEKDVAVADVWTPTSIESSFKYNSSSFITPRISTPNLYHPTFNSVNLKESMTLSPMFTPDNALDIHKAWIDSASSTIEIQNQYITQFDDNIDWDDDPSPLVRALIDAKNRGVTIRVQVNEDSDSDDVTEYFINNGIEVRWMGNSSSSTEGWLSDTHNKLLIIDGEITLLSSINFGENAFTNNREAGMVIQNSNVADYYLSIFESDWLDGEIPPFSFVPQSTTTTTTQKTTTTTETTPYSWIPIILSSMSILIIRRSRK